jgi:hypothetical protein
MVASAASIGERLPDHSIEVDAILPPPMPRSRIPSGILGIAPPDRIDDGNEHRSALRNSLS